MRAILLSRTGSPEKAFEIKDVSEPVVTKGQVKIKVEAFGLNFADVMARQGLYKDCPPLPTIIGYDVVGTVCDKHDTVNDIKIGDRVVALTRFGAYAEYAVTDAKACAKISETYDAVKATALSTQYCTAWYCFEEMLRLYKGDVLLIHAAAGGVGNALVQLALNKGCEIYATAGSPEKILLLNKMGVQHVINYKNNDYVSEIRKISKTNKPIDAAFNAIGGASVKKDISLLNSGGRAVLFGAAEISGKSLLGKIQLGLSFGFYHPAEFMMNSVSMIGVNMLRIADNKPDVLKRCLNAVIDLAEKNQINPLAGGAYSVKDIAKAHKDLQHRKSMGKLAIFWD
jgi:NADPH:quinone reductase-like Zn-dependent oxidoreductase